MEKEKITDAQIESVGEKTEEFALAKGKRRRADFYVEIVLIAILGFLIGVAIKTEAAKRVTIGFDDYKMRIFKNDYSLNELQIIQANKQTQEAEDQSGQSSDSGDNQANATGGSCSATE